MKRNALGVISAILLASTGIVAGLALPAVSHAAAEHRHEAHEHGDAPVAPQLNAGRKWETDAALRTAMGAIRTSMAAALHDIHEKRLPPAGYATLARKVESEVGEIVANCKLEPKADAQLHLVVADLLAGAEQMAAKGKPAEHRKGAVKVIGALEQYGAYFNDPGFKPIAH
ncbi:MAG: hypothetical protein C0466_15435 [Candidatus Accumulibacter sp.]|nr:hypothetical protein [Accumulibacter sp.]